MTVPSDAGSSSPIEVSGLGVREEEIRRYVRSPEDVIRLIAYLLTMLVLIALARWAEESVRSVEEDVIALFGVLSPAIERVLLGATNVIEAAVVVGVFAVPLVTRRLRLVGYLVAAAIGASLVMLVVESWLDRSSLEALDNALAERAEIASDAWAGTFTLAAIAAMFVAVGPFVTRAWRRAGWVTVALLVLARLLVSTRLPGEVIIAPAIGAVCGTLVLLALGRPDRHPTQAALRAALAGAGVHVEVVVPALVDARASSPYVATSADGTQLFLKVLSSEERAADLLYRGYRFARLKDVGDARPFSSLRRSVEHEAMVSMLAREAGVRSPRLRIVADVGESMLLAYDDIIGTSFDDLTRSGGDVSDELLADVWRQVAQLRAHGIAHRDLRRANLLVDEQGAAWLVDYGFSEVAVPGAVLDGDIAELLASLAAVVPVERAVAAAVDALGADVVGGALPRLQMTALSGATRNDLHQRHGLLDELQEEIQRRCGVDDIEFAPLQRVGKRTLFSVAVLVLATYFLLPQLADVPGIIQQVQNADWSWTPVLLLASTMTYVGAGAALGGAVPIRLPAGPLVLVAVAAEFANKLAPAGLGGMALNIRFLQKRGVDQPVAVSGVGLNTVAGAVGHIALIIVFIVWAGRGAFGSFELPDPTWFVFGLGVAVVLMALGAAIPATRRWFVRFVWPVVAQALDGVSAVIHRPGKLALLLGGSVLVTFANLVTLYVAIEAFGGGLSFATVGAVYLVGSAVAQAAPTPGGLGAVEAALISGLVAAGLDNLVAVPAVFLFRLFTFWLPVLPGWVAFQWMQRRHYL
ncbi:MAG: lysylphosphatidylglycerol synthase transmembrane domain-containing protein [Actinomycetota bacterium]